MTSRTYKDYPSGYFKILDHFSSTKDPLILKGNELKALNSRRRDLSRFFSTIANTENDPYAAELYAISRELTLSVSDKKLTLTVKWNEINSMLDEFLGEDYEPPAIEMPESKSEKKDEHISDYIPDELEELIRKRSEGN